MLQKNLLFVFILATLIASGWNTENLNAQIVEDGLVSYWSFDKDTIKGKTVEDIWGENDGTMFGDPKVVNGKVGQALEFDGEDDYVEVPHNEAFTISGKIISIEAWIKTGAFPGKYGMVFGKRGTEYEVGINIDGEPVWFFLGNNSLGTAKKKLAEGEWWHVVWIWDESSGQSYIYMNAQEVGDYVTADKSADTTDPVVIGRDPGTADASKYQFAGIIDEVRFYNRALNEAEIQKNFRAQGFAVTELEKLTATWGKLKSV
jgi:hypothetical protein